MSYWENELPVAERINPRTGKRFTINPETGIPVIEEWGYECGRGFISDSRFGSGQVIKRTNRNTTRKWRRQEGK